MEPENGEKKAFVSLRAAMTGPYVPMYLVYKYGMLFFILALLVPEIKECLNRPPGALGDPYHGLVIGLVLLFNHLAFYFEWPRRAVSVVRVVSVVWLLFATIYILYLSRLLYPLPLPAQ